MLDWQQQLNLLKSALPEGDELQISENNDITAIQKDHLRIELDKRNGKPATLISNFYGDDDALKTLAALLKKKCSAGGSARDGEILIQGDFRSKIADLLVGLGYKVKKINF
ncbi:MAG: translation initiation factor [Paludibacter sp.]|jgi:translation initiation factor 1|nr:translation initiation factor [Paludibacter sp.]